MEETAQNQANQPQNGLVESAESPCRGASPSDAALRESGGERAPEQGEGSAFEKGEGNAPEQGGNVSIKKNYLFSLANKLIAVVIPILITPYLARVLAADGNGVISYIGSIASYFLLFANIGIETYGQRVIAIHRSDKAYLKKFFVEIGILRLILTAACLAVYYVFFISSLNKQHNALYAIYAVSVLSAAFDFSWFFQGVEDFRLIAVTNIFTRIAYVLLVFLFVKQKTDIELAALFTVGNTVLPFFLCLPFVFRYIGGKIEGKIRPFSHFKECMVYFVPTVAIQIYTVLDKTMIGLITGSDFENGYYEQADKLVKLPLTVITSLFIIMRSRISYYFALGEEEKIRVLIEKSANVAMCLSLPMTFGMIAVAPTLVPVYLGGGYEKCVTLLYVLSPLIPIISISNLIGTHYYTPYNRQRVSNRMLIAGAAINLALNSFLIWLLQSVGAAIASVCAELIISALFMVFARKVVPLSLFFRVGWKYLVASLVMFACVFVMERFLPVNVWYLLAEVGAGMVVYAATLLVLRVRFVYDLLAEMKGKISRRFGRRG